MAKAFFIAGTDTDVGKTVIAAGLLAAANAAGLSTAALKPVAAGCEETSEGLRNADALLLQSTMSLPLHYDEINPVALREPIAPHIAAARAGRRLSVTRLAGFCRGVLGRRADFTLVEGAGGWRLPLGGGEFLSQLAVELQLPVILVVGLRLGCLNHALLSAEAIVRDGLPLAGWVGNGCGPDMAAQEENIATLHALLPAPCLGIVPRLAQPTPAAVVDHLGAALGLLGSR